MKPALLLALSMSLGAATGAGCGGPPEPPPGCVQNVLCVQGAHFDRQLCQCVPDAPVCKSATDCQGPLPQFCEICADGATRCAHFTCSAGHCAVSACD